MRMSELIYHKHYWSIPHSREIDNRIVQICYDCGKERVSPISLGFRERDDLRQPDGFCDPNESSDGTEEQANPIETGEERAPVVQHSESLLDILEAVAKRLDRKKKLAGG
jgi:hypothetical protein